MPKPLAVLAAAPQMQHTPDEQAGYVLMFVFMAAMPYLLLVVIGGGIFRARRRQRQREVERALEEQRKWEAAHAVDPDSAL
ncbi:MAG: hypothetical protein OXI39_13845 [Gemmatimonadota bacterium]|uniref:hypothetical protein n=1 Tax=Candidatus Palauibacter scopulicola TaxID=3056741 RepID=UPI0023950C2C|nr:hypothetical protein [Candidatus Palauibacter scopulicola]MDE2664073.1 hypothetical protein [Candidatus Palauibacter scopulicola]